MFNIMLPKINLRVEKWKYNREYEVYVSTLGNFKKKNKKRLPICIGTDGYCRVRTSCGLIFCHRLVMLTFKPIPNAENLTVDHLNHNKRENTIYNLEWVTKYENLRRARADLIIPQHNRDKNELAILAGQRVFENYNQAIDYCRSQMPKGTRAKAMDETIRHNIKHSIRTGKKYCGVVWNID